MEQRSLSVLLLLLLLGALAQSNIFQDKVRLGGVERCSGVLELRLEGEWRRAQWSEFWHLISVRAVCQALDCGSALSVMHVAGLSEDLVFYIRPDCVNQNQELTPCLWNGGTSHKGVRVTCSDSVRLLSGPSLCSGLVQIHIDQSWTTVCGLNSEASDVLCRELDCGPPSAVGGATSVLQGAFSSMGGALPGQTVTCEGHESSLISCSRSSCSSGPIAIRCAEPVRLVNSARRCAGTIQVQHGGWWSRLYTYVSWNLDIPARACRDLDCGAQVSMERIQNLEEEKVWKISPSCVSDHKAAVRDCTFVEETTSKYGIELVCSDSVRLVSGPTLCSGLVQVNLDQSWTPICDLHRVASEVLCRELGCGPPSVLQGARSTMSGPPSVLQGVLSAVSEAPVNQTFLCEGHESSLANCTRSSSSCLSGPTVISCSEPLMLVQGFGRCDGLLQMEHKQMWKTIYLNGAWDIDVVHSFCQDLRCGTAVFAERVKIPETSVWLMEADCVKQRVAGVRECVSYQGSSSYGVKLLCSELLNKPSVSVIDWVTETELQEPGIMLGSSFGIRCSVAPQFPGGYFQLLSPFDNITQAAVEHSAHFLFNDAGPTHFGGYTCVFHQEVQDHNFSSTSETIQLQQNGANQAAVWSQLTWLLLLGLVAGHTI